MNEKAQASVSPVRALDLELHPVEVARCFAANEVRELIFLDSSSLYAWANDTTRSSQPGARLSLIAAEPVEMVVGDLARKSDRDRLREAFSHYEQTEATMDLGVPLGGAFGSIDYDGTFRFGMYPNTLVYDHLTGSWLETGDGSLSKFLESARETAPVFEPRLRVPESTVSRAEYCEMVEVARDYIAAGDIYQVNLSHRFSTPFSGGIPEAFAVYEKLRSASPAPYAAFLSGAGDRVVLSSSPELFLSLTGRSIRTRPIKGTRPRFDDQKLDEKSAYDLITSPKEIAELIMITDLERNDLGQICEYGSVEATELLKLERYEQVFHLVSTVEGLLRPGIDAIGAVAACSPGGSITGAPKKRAREIISELEPEPRGLYTGAIGGFGFNGESRFSIAIRTAIAESGELHFHTGAGIVADSVPEKEYEETLHKAAGFFRACRH